jgi:hypothetical protein
MTELAQEAARLIDEAVFGKQIEDFVMSDIGKFLFARINAEIAEGVDELKKAAPTDAEAIRQAQNKVWRGEHMQAWLLHAIDAGLTATKILEDNEQTE